MTDTAANEIAPHLSSIFENEASGILQDLIGTPTLMGMMMFATEEEVKAARSYIIGIFEECYRVGHLRIMGSADDGALFGYALIFGHPSENYSLYCHKIYVYEQYRGNGIGSLLLGGILALPNEVGLVCSSDLVPFYESAGMHFKGNFTTPSDGGFTKTRGMYAGLCVMSTDSGEANGLPIFMLNDSDIDNIIQAIVSAKK
ncbi:TPA: GNAT family N-acetyltransferase [Serratia marcescens]|uniref:GNAT family N-acetyltransferase n=1 Tax=Serratia TaxID=613 RepID=UPI001021CA28|nr:MULTISPECIES: GNAT family N-acetyltransferase [Serratia]MBP1133480.1 GNAT superfamily N-acetyltransferase [Serratia sp. PL17]RYM67390.1 GNAT family N-acetyltransferase [Serratia liquefaciens]HBL7242152.1 GNAT family N-acetyltransferase [Serratia liquefaciens]HDS5482309.1 GNAT family N-acetyltransferase [Serratia liquefaciens]